MTRIEGHRQYKTPIRKGILWSLQKDIITFVHYYHTQLLLYPGLQTVVRKNAGRPYKGFPASENTTDNQQQTVYSIGDSYHTLPSDPSTSADLPPE